MSKKKQKQSNQMDAADDHRLNIRNIMKDIEFLGSSHMTWKERKEMENRKVVSLGGKVRTFVCTKMQALKATKLLTFKILFDIHFGLPGPWTQPPKKQRLPLSVARVVMKKQKEREEKMLKEVNMILGRFGGKLGGGAKRSADKQRPEDRVLKSSEGHFKNGVLDVKHLFQKAPPKDNDFDGHGVNKGKKKKGSGKKNRGKKKGGGGGRKRR
ncbi:hypothetical protein QUC31_019167 [Theobroma cacao]